MNPLYHWQVALDTLFAFEQSPKKPNAKETRSAVLSEILALYLNLRLTGTKRCRSAHQKIIDQIDYVSQPDLAVTVSISAERVWI
jgi:hypothetical protein